jgi:hypothetical protein
MRAAYGEKTRTFFANKANAKILIDFAGQRVFESATVDVNIILVGKNKVKQETLGCIIKEDCKNNMTDYIRQHGMAIDFSTSESWVILSPIEKTIKEKIERVGIPLRDWDISINYGIKTGCNEAFIIDKTKRDELIKKDAKSAEIIRPILRGRDIKRYGYEFADKYVIAIFPSKKYIIDDYPAVRDYLLKYGKRKLEQSGKSGARKKTNNKWFETQDTIAYWEDFSKQKIIWIELVNRPNFAFDDTGIMINNTVFFITGTHIHFLIAYLNSTLCDWQFGNICATSGAGTRRWIKMYIEQLLVPKVSNKLNETCKGFIKDLQVKKGTDKFKVLSKKVDDFIFSLYALTDEEIIYIQKNIASES